MERYPTIGLKLAIFSGRKFRSGAYENVTHTGGGVRSGELSSLFLETEDREELSRPIEMYHTIVQGRRAAGVRMQVGHVPSPAVDSGGAGGGDPHVRLRRKHGRGKASEVGRIYIDLVQMIV